MVIIDFEASGLHPKSYPIEAGWAGRSVAANSCLIKPPQEWLDNAPWEPAAEKMHGLSLRQVLTDGLEPAQVVELLLGDLQGKELFSDNPSFDQRWLDRLLAATGYAEKWTIQDLHQLINARTNSEERAYAQIIVREKFQVTHRAKDDALFLLSYYQECSHYF